MDINLSLLDALHLEVSVIRADERPERYLLDLEAIEESSRESIVGGFLLGLLRFKNLHLFNGDVAIAHEAVEHIAKVGLPETDYLKFMSLTQRARQEKDATLLVDALRYLNSAAKAGLGRALESLETWTELERGVMFTIQNSSTAD